MLQPLHTAAACGTVHQQYRAFDAEVAQACCAHGRASTLAPSRREGCGKGWFSSTFTFITPVYDMNSKIRARLTMRNEQGYKFISGLYRLGPKLRP